MTIINWLLLILILGLTLGVVYVFVFKKNKYFFRIRLLTGTKKLIIDDVAIEWKDKKKVSYLKLKKMKELVPMPPQDAIDLSRKGKKIVEAYRDERGNYAYVCDKGLDGFKQPIETNQRIILADQTIKAHSKKTGLMQYMPMIIGLGFVIILVLGGMVLIGEPLKAIQQFTSSAVSPILEAKRIDESILDKLIVLERDMQIIKSSVSDNPTTTPPPN